MIECQKGVEPKPWTHLQTRLHAVKNSVNWRICREIWALGDDFGNKFRYDENFSSQKTPVFLLRLHHINYLKLKKMRKFEGRLIKTTSFIWVISLFHFLHLLFYFVVIRSILGACLPSLRCSALLYMPSINSSVINIHQTSVLALLRQQQNTTKPRHALLNFAEFKDITDISHSRPNSLQQTLIWHSLTDLISYQNVSLFIDTYFDTSSTVSVTYRSRMCLLVQDELTICCATSSQFVHFLLVLFLYARSLDQNYTLQRFEYFK